jgi:hypothetical protein
MGLIAMQIFMRSAGKTESTSNPKTPFVMNETPPKPSAPVHARQPKLQVVENSLDKSNIISKKWILTFAVGPAR